MLKAQIPKCLIVIFAYALFLLFAMMQLKLDFSRSNFCAGDIIQLFSLPTWIYLMFLPVGILLIHKFTRAQLSWVIPFTLVSILFAVFPWIQYPSIFGWDSFRHGIIAKYITNQGYFPSNTIYQYPGAFVLLAVVSQILGLPILETSMLLASFVFLLVVCLFLVIGIIFVGRKSSWLVPTIYFAFCFQLYASYQYSPQLVGLAIYLIFVYAIVEKSFSTSARVWLFLLFILLATLTATHIFSAIYAVATLLGLYAGGNVQRLKNRNKQVITSALFLVGVLLLFSWHSFVASEIFDEATSYLSLILKGKKIPVHEILARPLHEAFTLPLTFYRYGIYSLFGFLSAIGLILSWHKLKGKLVRLLTLGTIVGGMLIYLSPAASYAIARFLIFGGIMVSILSSYAITRKHIRIITINKALRVLGIIVPFLVVGTFVASNLYYSTYTLFIHPDEISAATFTVKKVNTSITMVIDEALVFQFIAEQPNLIHIIDDRMPFDVAKTELEAAYVSLQYLPRQQYYYGFDFVECNHSLIYSNGLNRVYMAPHSINVP